MEQMKYKYTVAGNKVTISRFRFSVLSPTCIRVEASSTSEFEDRSSQVFLHRPSYFRLFDINTNLTSPSSPPTQAGATRTTQEGSSKSLAQQEENEKSGQQDDGEHESSIMPFTIRTSALTIQFFYEEGVTTSFTESNLIFLDESNQVKWRYSLKKDGSTDHNLLGTIRTLDFQRVRGRPVLERGLLDRDGYTIVDDSHTLVFNGSGWLAPRGKVASTVTQIGLKTVVNGEDQDFYYFSYGHNYQQCLKDFAELAGPVPLVPKWALGLWWSKWHPYTQQELTDLVDTFKLKKIPLSALCIDMDWHLVDVQHEPRTPSGWTGYTWNTKLIPSPPKLLEGLHKRGVRVALNLHPADGCYPHEEAYKEFAQFMGIDSESNDIIYFNIGDPKFAEGYFRFLHHPHEAIGVDMWWIDWQQEDTTSINSLAPNWWLNHLHHGNMLNKQARPLTFSRWGGLGSHRYPLGFSGDTIADWSNLQMLPYITATAANVWYDWWSHDIGGFMWGTNDPDLYIRWFQLGALSPILRLHSTKDEFEEKLPWKYDKGTFAIIKDILKFRESLVPYIYSIAWRMHTRKDASLVFPTYYEAPTSPNAYSCPHQYFFGSELLVAPFLSKVDPDTRLSRAVVWFPPGKWYSFESGEEYQGDRFQVLYGRIDEMNIFAPQGAIVPRAISKIPPNTPILNFDKAADHSLSDCDMFEIKVFAGADREFLLYDDDGSSMEYLTASNSNITRLSQQFSELIVDNKAIARITFTIAAPASPQHAKRRVYCVKLVGIPHHTTSLLNVKCFVGDQQSLGPITFNSTASCREIVFQPIYSDLALPVVFIVEHGKESVEQATERMHQQRFDGLTKAISVFNTYATIKSNVAHTMQSLQQEPEYDWIFTSGFDDKSSALRAHVEMAASCGSACFETPENTYLVLWNYNNLVDRVIYECKSNDPAFCCSPADIPFERVLTFSKEFKASNNCTIIVMYGKKWEDVYSIGTVVSGKPSSSSSVEKKKGFLQQIKMMF